MDPDSDAENIRKRSRIMSVENTTLTEVITAYEKLKKGRDSNGVFLVNSSLDVATQLDINFNAAEETFPVFNIPFYKYDNSRVALDFNKFQNFQPQKYLYFSQSSNLLQSNKIEQLSPEFSKLLQAKSYWLNIFDPNEHDFSILFHSYGVHDITVNDIREGNTEEKIEVYAHYTFISLRLMCENKIGEKIKNEDVDFNIILFKDFIITLHHRKWSSIKDMVEFINILSTHSQSIFTPDWVLFSCFVEMNQDAKYMIDQIEPDIDSIRVQCKSVELSDIILMKRNFDLELQLYTISRFIKPKLKILKQLKIKCSKRLDKLVLRLLGDISEDFRDLCHDVHNFNHILERSQDTFLSIVASDQSKQDIEMNRVMKRVSELALIFLPAQTIGGFFGMNVLVPFKGNEYPTLLYFWIIIGASALLSILLYLLRKQILRY